MRFGAIAGNGGKLFSTPFTNQCYGIVFGQTYGANYWMFSPMYRASDLSNTSFAFINKAWSGIPGTVLSTSVRGQVLRTLVNQFFILQ